MKEWIQVAVAMAASIALYKRAFLLLLFSQRIYITAKLVIKAPVLSCWDTIRYITIILNYIEMVLCPFWLGEPSGIRHTRKHSSYLLENHLKASHQLRPRNKSNSSWVTELFSFVHSLSSVMIQSLLPRGRNHTWTHNWGANRTANTTGGELFFAFEDTFPAVAQRPCSHFALVCVLSDLITRWQLLTPPMTSQGRISDLISQNTFRGGPVTTLF